MLVDLGPDLAARWDAHDHDLAVYAGRDDLAEVGVRLRAADDVEVEGHGWAPFRIDRATGVRSCLGPHVPLCCRPCPIATCRPPPTGSPTATGSALLALRPTLATYVGDDRFDDRLDDPGPAGRAAVRSLHERTLAELDELGPETRDDVTGDILRFVCEAELAVEASGWPLLESVNQVEGPQLLLSFMAQVQAFGTPDRVDRWLARLAAYPAFIDAHLERIREARDRGILPARLIAERVVDGLERSLAAPAETSPLVTVPDVPDPADRARIADAVRESVQPADARLLAAIRALLPETRSLPGSRRRARWRRDVRGPDPAVDHAPQRTRGSPPVRPRRPRSPRRGAAGDQPRRGLRRRHRRLSAGARERAGQRPGLGRRAARADARGPRSGPRRRPGLVRPDAVRAVRDPPARPDPRPRLARPLHAPGQRARRVLHERHDPARPGLLAVGHDHLPRDDPRPPSPAGHRGRARGALGVPPARRPRVVRGVRRGLGALLRSGWPTRWASTAPRANASGCSTPRPGGPPAWSPTPASTRSAGSATGRSSSSSSGPGSTARPPGSRSTATWRSPPRRSPTRWASVRSSAPGPRPWPTRRPAVRSLDIRRFHDTLLGSRIAAARGHAGPAAGLARRGLNRVSRPDAATHRPVRRGR